jgi:excisionase family DNA binding protein
MSVRAPLLDVEGAAAYLNVSETFVRRIVRLRKIRHTKLGGSSIRFTQEDLDALVEDGRVEPTA